MARVPAIPVTVLAAVLLSLPLVTGLLPQWNGAHSAADAALAIQDAPEEKSPPWKTTLLDRRELARGIERLVLHPDVGSILVKPARDGKLTIRAEVKVDRQKVSEEELTEVFTDHVRVEAKERDLAIVNAHIVKDRKKQPWSVSLTIETPRPLAILGTTKAGAIRVESARGSLALTTGAGSIAIRVPESSLESVAVNTGAGAVELTAGEIHGAVKATTGAGAVKLACPDRAPEGNVVLRTGAGSLSVRLPEGASGVFDMTTPVGAIKVDPQTGIAVKRSTVGARATGEIGRNGPRYDLETGTGSIRLELGR